MLFNSNTTRKTCKLEKVKRISDLKEDKISSPQGINKLKENIFKSGPTMTRTRSQVRCKPSMPSVEENPPGKPISELAFNTRNIKLNKVLNSVLAYFAIVHANKYIK